MATRGHIATSPSAPTTLEARRHLTIVAPATPSRPGARAIVRTSGPDAKALALSLGITTGHAGVCQRCVAQVATHRLPLLCLAFSGPHSHTGEDVVEYHLPGSPPLVERVVAALVDGGGVLAQPGEFSARAFFNGRLSLAGAEAIAATIAAENEAELAAALRLQAGDLVTSVEPLRRKLTGLLALCELGIDFTEEDVEILPAAQLRIEIEEAREELLELLRRAGRTVIQNVPLVAFVGRPNAGKSTLINALTQNQRAVISSTAGTTRDALESHVLLRGGPVRVVDTAGIDDHPLDELDVVAQATTRRISSEADLLILVIEAADRRPPIPVPRPPDLVVRSKIDLVSRFSASGDELGVSAFAHRGVAALEERIAEIALTADGMSRGLLNARHRRELENVETILTTISVGESVGEELVAFQLRTALDRLGRIVGEVTPDDVLSEVFGRFCIGK